MDGRVKGEESVTDARLFGGSRAFEHDEDASEDSAAGRGVHWGKREGPFVILRTIRTFY